MKLLILIRLRCWKRRRPRWRVSLLPDRAGFFPRGPAARRIPARKLFRLDGEVPGGRACPSIDRGSRRLHGPLRRAIALWRRPKKSVLVTPPRPEMQPHSIAQFEARQQRARRREQAFATRMPHRARIWSRIRLGESISACRVAEEQQQPWNLRHGPRQLDHLDLAGRHCSEAARFPRLIHRMKYPMELRRECRRTFPALFLRAENPTRKSRPKAEQE